MSQANAAHYLCEVLEFVCTQEKSGEPLYISLAAGLEVGNPDTNPNGLTEIFVLLSTVEKQIKRLKQNSKLSEYLIAVQEFHIFLVQHGICQLKWEQFRDFVKQKNLILVFHACASFIASEQFTYDLSQDQLKDFLEEAELMLKEITDSDLASDIKKYLIIRLEEICSAMRHYATGGAEHLSLVVEASLGGLLLRRVSIVKDKEKPVYQKLLGFLLTLGGLLDLGANIQGYALPKVEEVRKWLLPPG